MNTCIYNVRIIIGSGDVIGTGFIVFNEREIVDVGAGDGAGSADRRIDGTGMTALPGLMDCHVHLGMDCSADPFKQIAVDSEADTALKAYRHGWEFLEYGVTTVRNLGTRYNADVSFRNAIAAGIVEGPRIFASGSPIVMTGGHGHVMAIEADGVQEVVKAVRSQIKSGVDLIKLMATGGVLTAGSRPGAVAFGEEELRCACLEAAKTERTTAAHATGLEGAKHAVRAGITSIEHGHELDDEVIALMKDRGTFLVPTLAAGEAIMSQPEGVIPEFIIEKVRGIIEKNRASFRRAFRAGVDIAFGTDAGTPFNFPGRSVLVEMKLMIENGMTPLQAIRSATHTASRCVRFDHALGTLERGKLADVLLVAGNPADRIEHLANVRQVYKSGKLIVDRLHAREGEGGRAYP